MAAFSFLCLLFALLCYASVKGDDSSSYVPCKSYISYSFDDSYTLQGYRQFKSQIGFIKDSIGSFNHPELLQVEGIYSTEFNWNNGLSIAQMVSSISSIEQTTNSYSLSKQTAKLLTSVQSLGNVSDPIIAFIFVSNTSDAALAGADRYISQLKNVEITFILLGMDTLNSMDLSVTQLAKFSRKIVRWYIVNEYNYPIFYPEDYGCTYYIPCQSYITILSDVSYVLTGGQFDSQLDFLSKIFTNVTHFERIQYGIYNDAYAKMLYSWNSYNNRIGFKSAISNTIKDYKPTNLGRAMSLLSATIPSTALIFVSDTSDDDMINSAVESYNLFYKNTTKLTFIAIGNKADGSKLLGFEDAIIYNWQNAGTFSSPDGWDMSQALRCSPRPTPIVPLTPMPTADPSNMIPYFPCQSWIGFGIDVSTSLDPSSFKNMLNFVSSAIGVLNHPERVAAVYPVKFDKSNIISWNNNLTINQIQSYIPTITQGPYVFSSAVRTLVQAMSITQTAPTPISIIFFITDTSASDLYSIKDYLKAWSPRARITFVLVGPKADSAPLRKFSTKYHYIYWPDLSQPQPDNWAALSNLVYGCESLN